MAASGGSVGQGLDNDLRPSRVQIIRRLSMETFRVLVYAGPLCQDRDFVPVEAEKTSSALDIVKAACRKMRLSGTPEQFELAEVFSSGGQLCKERRLEDIDTPVCIQLLWPKVINAEMDHGMGLFTGYRFYIRRKDPEVSRSGWIECKDQSMVDTFLMSFLQKPVGSKEYQDLCNLPDLNEKTLLRNIKARFISSKIYTYVGSILIAVNPFKFFPIYNPKYVKMYQNKHLGELPPHIFAIADAAYHSMLQNRQNQCIVISGESGSGKTESTNLLLHHLTALSHKGLHGSGVEQTILGAGPVLEAFGNAKTVHNNNSSRFGKFIQVNYKENGMVHGAVVEKYLLEKSRIVCQAKNERNYHVFYYMLAGADEKEREAFGLLKPEDYRYLSHSEYDLQEGVDEEHEFSRLKQSMEMVGFSSETQRKIFCVLSAVLCLGNVEFKKKGEQHHDESVVVSNEETIRLISHLLKVEENTVRYALTQKKTTAGDETFTINYKMEDAVATRDAMAKCLYGALFDWIVLKVNQALLAKKHNSEHEGNSIGVLDIFGFEDFGRNSFEQFCINYANEHLQYYFNQHVFKLEQEEYQREGIQWENVDFIDNTACLEIFSKRPNGLFYLLDEECSFPGATNDTLLSKFTHNHRGNVHYKVPQLKEEAFIIDHYAGLVKYFVKDFREKNSDLVSPEIVSTLKKSSLSFVRELMGIDPVAVLRWSVVRSFFRCVFAFISAGHRYRASGGADKKARKRISETLRHQSSAKDLFRGELGIGGGGASGLSTVPEEQRWADGDDVDLVNSQRHELHEELLLYSTMESSLPPSDAQVIRRARQLIMKSKSFKPRPRPALSFRDVKALKAIASRTMFSGVRMSSKKQPPTVSAQFQWSLSCLLNTLNQANPFFIRCIKSNSEKAPCQFDDDIVLRQLRYTGMLATVKIRQSGYNYRLLFEEFIQLYQILLPQGLLSCQDDVKLFLLSMNLNMDNCQIGKSKVFLRESEKLLLDEALHTAIMKRVIFIQRWAKSRQQHRYFQRLKEATIVLQKHTRRFLAQALLHRMQSEQDGAITIQRLYSGWRVRRAYNAYRDATVFLQSHIKAFITRRKFLLALMEKRQAEAQRVMAEKKARQEELQSSASDEGVMVKGSSAEELLEKDFKPIQRRDSEESSGILEDSDSDALSADTRHSREGIPSVPSNRKDVYVVPGEHDTSVDGRVHESEHTKDETDGGHVYFVRRTSHGLRPKRSTAPLASEEDVELSPNKEAVQPEDMAPSAGPALSPEDQAEVNNAVFTGKPAQSDISETEESRALASDSSSHLSPFHRAKKRIRNIMGSSRKKKENTDSDEEGEDSQQAAPSSSCRKGSVVSEPVLPHPTPPVIPSAGKGKSPVAILHEVEGEKPQANVPRAKRKRKQRRDQSEENSQQGHSSQSRSHVNFYGTSEWQYADNMKITDVHELHRLDEFICQRCRELFKEGKGESTVYDRIFKGALDGFGQELKTVIGVEMQHAKVVVKYRELFEKFRQVLMAEIKKEKTEAAEVMALNAFRGFLDEFMKQQAGRRREKKEERSKADKPVKRDKHKKDVVEHLGHRFVQVQFGIRTFCEYCSSLIWIMDKGQVCQVCKYTCHKKCTSKSASACPGKGVRQNAGSAKVFGAPLESLLKAGEKIPLLVERMINAIETQGLFTEGLYRKSGSAPKARELRAHIETDMEAVVLEEYPVHVLSSVLKSFLRELPEPVLTFELFDDFLRGSEIKDRREQVQCMFAMVEKLPKANYDLFERLIFHLAKVAMHEDSTKMSVNGLAIIFAPCLLRTNKEVQAQESLNQVPKQTSCIEVILSEELATVKCKLDDITMLESAEQTAEERLFFVHARLRESRVKADLQVGSPSETSVEQGKGGEEETGTSQDHQLSSEARALKAHIVSIHKERKKLTSKLPMLETRQASSDEDMLTGDETDSVFDSTDMNEEDMAAYDIPDSPPFLRQVTRGRVPIPSRKRPPLQHSGGKTSSLTRNRKGMVGDLTLEPFSRLHHMLLSGTDSASCSSVGEPESDSVSEVGGEVDEDNEEIMV